MKKIELVEKKSMTGLKVTLAIIHCKDNIREYFEYPSDNGTDVKEILRAPNYYDCESNNYDKEITRLVSRFFVYHEYEKTFRELAQFDWGLEQLPSKDDDRVRIIVRDHYDEYDMECNADLYYLNFDDVTTYTYAEAKSIIAAKCNENHNAEDRDDRIEYICVKLSEEANI